MDYLKLKLKRIVARKLCFISKHLLFYFIVSSLNERYVLNNWQQQDSTRYICM